MVSSPPTWGGFQLSDRDDDPTEPLPPPEQPPERIGPYRILEKIGEGGMGTVYAAEQTEPVRRKVALKIIKQGMDTAQIVARFEAERQALAMMEHPCVAKVFDAGATPAGRPYFAMEFVQGVPITEHCDNQRLTMPERLELFRQVCDGVQHAHQKAIIHRDLKPSNVLVSYGDGPVGPSPSTPKIIDFGVAKATAQRLTERTLFTERGVLIGTPEYMSPEQAEMSGQNVDTRTDVYALGVILYELLVGTLPFEPGELRATGFDGIRRKIREEEPSKPSTRFGTLRGNRSTESANRRRTDPSTLRRQLSGDLDWITMKALEKDRARRYASPAELSADVGRHLRDEPVLASPPSVAYRTGKFVRRHRLGVGIATAALVGLAVFAGAMVVQSRKVAKARDQAERVSDFMIGLYKLANPASARGDVMTVREMLDEGAARVDEEFSDTPELRARMLAELGLIYKNLGLYGKAEPLLERAVEMRGEMAYIEVLATVYAYQGRYDEAEPMFERLLETTRRESGDDHPDTLMRMGNLATLYDYQGRYTEAETLSRSVLDSRRRTLGNDDPATLGSINSLAVTYHQQGRYDDAERLYAEALATQRRVLGEDHPATIDSLGNLGVLYSDQGRLDEAESAQLESLEASRRVLGEEHPGTLGSMSNLAIVYEKQGRFEEAERVHVDALEASKRTLGLEHPTTLGSMDNLAILYEKQGRQAESGTLHEKVLEVRTRVLGPEHPETILSVFNLGVWYFERERLDEAERQFVQALEAQRQVLGPEHPETIRTIGALGACYYGQGRDAESERISLEAYELQKRILGHDHPETRQTEGNLIQLYRTTNREDEAERLEAVASAGS